MSALIRLTDVSKRYGDAAALLPTNLDIERGKTTVLIGPSGCGKSTLLRLIIHLIEPDSGSITFDGEPISSTRIRAQLEAGDVEAANALLVVPTK